MQLKTWHRLIAVLLSVVLLSLGWWGASGLTMLVALVPLLIMSEDYSDSHRDWWRMCGWAALTFLLWNAATIWWVWIGAHRAHYCGHRGHLLQPLRIYDVPLRLEACSPCSGIYASGIHLDSHRVGIQLGRCDDLPVVIARSRLLERYMGGAVV